jgi:recombination protein RecR
MDPIERLTTLFERFPGIGPRQAGRFVQFLLRSSPSVRRELVDSVQGLAHSVRQCPSCFRYHASESANCGLCANKNRDDSLLAVVASDADLFAIERSGTYNGRYFVLGGTVSLASEKMSGLRVAQLKKYVTSHKNLTEAVLAFPANPEGDATAIRIREELQEELPALKISMLGRGLSTGSELEYADADTLKNALDNRK